MGTSQASGWRGALARLGKKKGKKGAKKRRPRRDVKAGCVVFTLYAIWKGHRYLSYIFHFNDYLSRMSRVSLFVLSVVGLLVTSGGFVQAPDFTARKDQAAEQVLMGVVAAAIVRVWIFIVTAMMTNPRPHDYKDTTMEHYVRTKRRNEFVNSIVYWIGMGLTIGSIMASIILIFFFVDDYARD